MTSAVWLKRRVAPPLWAVPSLTRPWSPLRRYFRLAPAWALFRDVYNQRVALGGYLLAVIDVEHVVRDYLGDELYD